MLKNDHSKSGSPALLFAAGALLLSSVAPVLAQDKAPKNTQQTATEAETATPGKAAAPKTPAAVAASGPASGGYKLGVMDKLRIRVAEWQPADGTVRDWDVVGGEYTVGPSGALSLPFIGDLDAAGKTTAEVASLIGQQLRDKFALRNLPSASVEISQYRPVYLAGDVTTPGEFPYSPNLTVLKAVSLAGGLRRSDAGQRFAKDFINAQGDVAVYDNQRGRLIARRARLVAEVSGSRDLPIPAELKDVPNAAQLIASETSLMKSRRDRYELQLQALNELRSLLESEVKSLAQKTETQQRQLDLVSENRDKMSRLTEQGLATSSRLLTIEERTASIQSTLLDIDTSTLKAKQDISQANQDEINLRNDWEADRAKELQDTEAELEKLGLQLTTSRQLISEAVAQSAEALRFDPSKTAATIKYTVVRDEGDGPKEVAVDENARLMPGDVVKVTSELLMQ
ncbi:polysaccharide biosynthesis/export family protein [Rhizobium sp. Leaf306]|uniref:polysaccharide biosynthesis/export family protein n=1 Tax=Rhizobium sp. Leaf306 TaxID=1736330 RepID=UPI0009EAFA9A|nr:polysaccharide biosynthesis/export family protein [Rhizobium sp. Leaf306]